MVMTALEHGHNTTLGLAIGFVFLGLAGLARIGWWWVVGLVALVSALLTLAAIGQLMERLGDGSIGDVLAVLAFQSLTLTASVTGSIVATRAYGANDEA